MRQAVIMAGGFGGRLWPLSRRDTPKQFLPLIGNQTLLQQAYERVSKVLPDDQIWVATQANYVEQVRQQLPKVNPKHIIIEPLTRNTAPAVALATLTVLKVDPDANLFGVVPADHYVGKPDVFASVTKLAFEYIEQNSEAVVTIGIHPDQPKTGYGYIKTGGRIAFRGKRPILKVESFHEKPSSETAQGYIESGQYLWNGGYFLFNGSRMIEQYQHLAPKVLSGVKDYLDQADEQVYAKLEPISFDTAIAEKLKQLVVIPADMEWSDVGDWAALHEILLSHGSKNALVESNHIGNDSGDNLLLGGSKLIATVGLTDVVVINTDDVILICNKNNAQDVKQIVEQLRQQGRLEYL